MVDDHTHARWVPDRQPGTAASLRVRPGTRAGAGTACLLAVVAAWLAADPPHAAGQQLGPPATPAMAPLPGAEPLELLPPPDDAEPPADAATRPPTQPPTQPPLMLPEHPLPTLKRDDAEPLESLPEAQPQPDEDDVVRERYPNGRIRVERHVALDADDNYVNHGRWRMWNRAGAVIMEGTYRRGIAHGIWSRWYQAGEAALLGQQPFSQFTPPFLSRATFEDGKLNGVWSMSDRQQRKMFEIAFASDQRHGKATWWHPSGYKLREMTFREGLVDGEQLAWTNGGQPLPNETFESGQKIAQKTERHPNRRKRAEGQFIYQAVQQTREDDWWACQLAEYVPGTDGQKQGVWRTWHTNGQLEMEGRFERDQPRGEFTWWHENGQKALAGAYNDAAQLDGEWTWWYENGQKRSRGEYRAGAPIGPWKWWEENGKLARSATFPSQGEVSLSPGS